MLNLAGRQVGVSLPEGQGRDRISDVNKVLYLGKPMELRPLRYSDEFGRVHETVVYVSKDEDENGKTNITYFYPPTEEAVKGWRSATKIMQQQIEDWISRESIEPPKQDSVDVVAGEIAGSAQMVDVLPEQAQVPDAEDTQAAE